MTTAAIPRLEDYDVSEKTGFNVENPEVTLPEYFDPWTAIKDDLVGLITRKEVRDKVNEMPLLDHTRLQTDRQRRLAHMILTFIGSGYVWQDGNTGVAESVPEQLAVPWCALSELVGLPPVITLSTVSLSNYRIIDENKPLNIENMTTICDFPGGDSTKQFFLIAAQIELDALPGLKAILKAMQGVETRDVQCVISSLNNMSASLKDVMDSMERLNKNVDPGDFYNALRPFLSGWGSNGSPLPDGLIYEGASPRQQKLNGGSQAQSTSIQCFDAALRLDHPAGDQAYLNEVRNYMPKLHAKLIEDLWQAPSIKLFGKTVHYPITVIE
jgi:indoleamine 2,3-dioxygenase